MTLVDTNTGEIVSRSLAIPRPADVTNVYDLCSAVEYGMADVSDVAEAYDAKAKLAAIDTYLAQTSRDGRSRLAATMRRLETRIGDLLGDPEHGGDRGNQHSGGKSAATDLPLSKDERREFRLMASHPDVVEAVITESSDDAPASRKKVLEAIRVHVKTTEKEKAMARMPTATRGDQIRHLASLGMTAEQIAEELDITTGGVYSAARRSGTEVGRMSKAAIAGRITTAKRMAAEGSTSRQIAAAIGIKYEAMNGFRQRHGIDVPADAIVGSRRAIDSNRIVNETVMAAINLDAGLDLVDYAALDIDQIGGWVVSLQEAIGSLKTLMNNLNKEKTTREQP